LLVRSYVGVFRIVGVRIFAALFGVGIIGGDGLRRLLATKKSVAAGIVAVVAFLSKAKLLHGRMC
jgi:UPF0716 family protein affecting phage T7 exclusion